MSRVLIILMLFRLEHLLTESVVAHPTSFFFFNDTATTEIYTLSLHDALPICEQRELRHAVGDRDHHRLERDVDPQRGDRSEEHTSELQSPDHLVCRLLLEKKKNTS